MQYVLDTFAVMAYLRREANSDIVRSIILETLAGECQSYMSAINLGELFYMQSRKSGAVKAETALRFVRRAGIIIEPATNARILRAARLKATVSLSYADAFAATLSEELNAVLVTGDPEYKPLEPTLKIMWL